MGKISNFGWIIRHPYHMKAKTINWTSLTMCLLILMPYCDEPVEKQVKWPEKIQVILDNTTILKYDSGNRLPLYLWPAIDPGILSDDMAERLITEMNRRGIGIVCSWSMIDTSKVLSQCLPIARAQKKLGQRININATGLLDSFFDGDEATAHIDAVGKPFFDNSFGDHKMGCPFALDSRKEDHKKTCGTIRKQV